MTYAQATFEKRIREDLAKLEWTPDQIEGFIAAELIHGVLNREIPHWKVAALYQAWPRYKPTSKATTTTSAELTES